MKSINILLLFLIGITSCKKEVISSEPPYIEQWWDEYYGIYTVFDTANDVTYQMEIKQIERNFNGIFIDSVSFINVANKFDVGRIFEQNVTYLDGPSIGVFDSLMDVDNYNWTFSAGLSEKESNDTLELKYTKSNIQYYMDDGVPFYNCICIDLAVKNE